MPPERESVVRALMDAANAGMIEVAKGSTANEVFSAHLSNARNAVIVAKSLGVPAETLRKAVQKILLYCDDPDLKVM